MKIIRLIINRYQWWRIAHALSGVPLYKRIPKLTPEEYKRRLDQMSEDFASIYNLPIDEVMAKLENSLTGMTK